jgi:ATP-dependent Clp protease ATP-binding subunit ClpC
MTIISKWTGIPLARMEEREMARLLRMEDELEKQVVGQKEAVIRHLQGPAPFARRPADPRRPIGSFIFLGPTGVGKTLLAKALAEFMFNDKDALIQIDMSEYMEKFACPGWWVRLPATWATTRAASSPRRCAAVPTPSCCSTRSRRRTPT